MATNSNGNVFQNPCYMLDGYNTTLNCIPQPPYNQQMMYTTLIATGLWCIVVVLAISALQEISKANDIYSQRMQRILLCYVVWMTLFSTGALVQNVIYVQNLLFSTYDIDAKGADLGRLIYTSVSITLPVASFSADGLMAWRCWVLYQGVRRYLRLSVGCLLIFLLMCSLASAGVTLGLPDSIYAPATPLLAVTITTNLVLSALIVSRLLYHERCLRKKRILSVQDKMSSFENVMAMCVESCALIVVFSACALGMEWSVSNTVWNLSVIPMTLLPHICVISPLMIIIRVANGRAPSTTVLPSSTKSEDFGAKTDTSVTSI